MPRELITIQVGQCGNQIGTRFWELALREHAAYNAQGVYDDALSSFFRNVDTRFEPPINLPVRDGTGVVRSLKARAVIVDMEEGVINELLKGPMREVFDTQQLICDVSGAGNNWAHGHHVYGPQYREGILDKVRRTVEDCDSLQSFLLLHSLGGGTGSGLGSYILEALADEYPDVFRFTTSIFPSADDDVVTSPYNAMLALSRLVEHADCVLPAENQALLDICERMQSEAGRGKGRAGSTITGVDVADEKRAKPFDAMNGIAANLLLNLTSSVRFEGSLNVDLNDITMNLVPFPRMHFLISSMSPLAGTTDVAKAAAPRTLDQAFTDTFSRDRQLTKTDPQSSTYLACAMMLRGAVNISDINRNIARMRPKLKMIHWNSEGFKVGLCSRPPVGLPFSLLNLSNNCCVAGTFATMLDRYDKLYKRRLFLHHYEQFMDAGELEQAASTVSSLMQEYNTLDRAKPPDTIPRLRPRGLSFI